MLTRILTYGFVFFLIFLEWLLRTLSNVDSQEFMGPTLAAAGIGLLVPLTTAKNKAASLSSNTQQQILGYIVISKKEQTMVGVIWIFLFLLLTCWTYDLCLIGKKCPAVFGISPLWLGGIAYFVAVILSEVKESI